MTCLAALPCENGNWQFEEASTLMFVFYGYTEKFNRISRNRMFRSYCLYLYLELSLSLSRFINFYLRYVPVVSSVSYK
jgi:hypothetical protein